MTPTSILFDRVVLGAAIVLTAVLFSARLDDPVNIIKMTALVLCAITLLASCAIRAIRLRVVQLPWGRPALAGVVLLLAFVVVALASPVWNTALLGTYGRNSGLLTYASALVLFLVGLRVLDAPGTRVILYALMIAGGFTAGYGLLQYAGIDPVAWNNPFNPIIAAMGNPNFAAAYVAICSPAAAWGALRTGWGVPWRVASGVLLVLCLAAAVLSEAAQGPLAAAPGLAVLAVAWLLDRSDEVRRLGLGAVAGIGVVGLGLVGLGLGGSGVGAVALGDGGTDARRLYWATALDIWRDSPWLGAGLETFGPFWRMERPASAGGLFTDAAHSVPLQLLATGGVVLGLAYVVFVAAVGWVLLLGLRRLHGADRLLLGALGGCWVAYQVQSLVSIDQVPLVVVHMVLGAGVVAAAGGARLREVRQSGAAGAPAVWRRSDVVVAVAVGLLTSGATWGALLPLRASATVAAGDRAAARGDAAGAEAAFDSATELLPGEARYWRKRAQLHRALAEPELAMAAFRRAMAADGLDLVSVRQAAELADEQGLEDEARELRARAASLERRS